jgi:hypothetical protein
MVSITQFWKSAPLEANVRSVWSRLFLAAWVSTALLMSVSPPARAASLAHAAGGTTAQVTQLRTERTDDGVYLNAAVAFELPHVVEDALLKGIALFFVVEVEIYRDRWYWTDQRVASAARTIRLAYQPLTRRWRVNIGSGLIGAASSGLRATFNQNYDSLPEAMSAVQRVARWKVADTADIRSGSDHKLMFSFKLDLSQLPRPFQIGVAGQRDWSIVIDSAQPLVLPSARSTEAAKDNAAESLK